MGMPYTHVEFTKWLTDKGLPADPVAPERGRLIREFLREMAAKEKVEEAQ